MIYDVWYKTLIYSKHFQIRFDKIDGIIRIHDGTKYLTLFGTKKYDVIYNRIRYLISLKSRITYIFFSLFCENQSWFLWFFTYRKILTLHVIILIKSFLNEDKNHYYYKILLEKCSYQLTKN